MLEEKSAYKQNYTLNKDNDKDKNKIESESQ